ncbi:MULTISPECIES: autoinducer 2 ABC transporter substrate-binding protein [Peribacillus]|uniref:autoinducer 2 ABC transporter substrate-binding protein n=1 Tax=Peribacillus TaxID=2675229 RepID=UPI001F4DFB03|nr:MULTISPECIES: autoinducer 2 ABC transporter substrate-binding protein [unclassified Peribacillus]MCK1983485.1 autoinducer 2 ABC transporter substrate-binding protein [Peribacillus sp. Aquil_B1]MCK2006503.1 autoinducer 2 ABC transporter substrate-binding protein [Peribacillus sp. Aquil_B8]
MKKMTGILATAILAGGLLTGCVSQEGASGNSEKETSGGSGNEKLKIAVVPKLMGIPYFNASEKGAIQAGKDLGVETIYTGPTEPDAAQQVKVIEDLISQDVDVIAVAPNDAASLSPVLQKAKDEGIIVMDWDTPADQSLVELSVHQIDDEAYGRHIAKSLVKQMGVEKGQIAILTGGLSAANLNTWIDAAKKELEENYPGIELVSDKIATDEKQQVAYQKTLDLIKSNPELKGIMAFSTPAPLGAAQAVQEKELQDDITVVGTALPKDSSPYLNDGSLDVAILWEPDKLGYLTVALAKRLAEGEKPEDGLKVENVGEIDVWEDGKTIIMGPPTDFTKDNAADFNF